MVGSCHELGPGELYVEGDVACEHGDLVAARSRHVREDRLHQDLRRLVGGHELPALHAGLAVARPADLDLVVPQLE